MTKNKIKKSIIAESLNLVLILGLYNKDKGKAATMMAPRRKQHEQEISNYFSRCTLQLSHLSNSICS